MITRKRIFILFSVPVVLVLAVLVLTWWKQEEIKHLAVEQLNRVLKVPVEVGDMDFSLLASFPSASIEFKAVRCKGSPVEGCKVDLLQAGSIRLLFGWFEVFTGNLRFKRIELEEASFNIFFGKKGRSNTDVFKDTGPGGGAPDLELSDVRIFDTRFTYFDQESSTDIGVQLSALQARGLFREQRFDLSAEGGVRVEHLRWKEVDYFSGKRVDLKFVVLVDKAKDVVEIKEGSLDVGGLLLNAQGRIGPQGDPSRYDFILASDQADLKGLLALVPGGLPARWKDFSCSGKVYFQLGVKGNPEDGLDLHASFGADNASIRPAEGPHALESVRFKGTFSNRFSKRYPVEDLHISGFEALLDGQKITGGFRLTDFRNPSLELRAKAALSLEQLGRFYMPDTIESMQGAIVADLSLKGRVRDRSAWVSNGTLSLQNGSFRLRGSSVQYEALSGRMEFGGSRLLVNAFSGRADGSDFRLDGHLDNVYAYVLSGVERVSGELKLTSRNLDLDELFRDKSVSSTAGEAYRFSLPARILVRLRVDVGLLSFRKFQAWRLSGNITLDDQVLNGENIAFKAFDGDLALTGRIDATSEDSLTAVCDAQVKNINVTELFAQLGNFGQQVMTDQHVKGTLTADIGFASAWTKELVCDYRRLYTRGKLRIENGELNRFEPLLALSRYLKGADLSNVRFATLENTIEIRNRTIHIPAMEIRSSALDLIAAGTHTFDNQVDYALELTLSQLLGKRVRDRNTEFGTIEDEGRGRMKLFLTMKGPMDDPRIQYNRRGVEKKIVEEVKNEKVVAKDLLRQEFGWFKKDSTLTKPRKKDEPLQELQIDSDEE